MFYQSVQNTSAMRLQNWNRLHTYQRECYCPPALWNAFKSRFSSSKPKSILLQQAIWFSDKDTAAWGTNFKEECSSPASASALEAAQFPGEGPRWVVDSGTHRFPTRLPAAERPCHTAGRSLPEFRSRCALSASLVPAPISAVYFRTTMLC